MEKIIVAKNSLLKPLYENIVNNENYQISELTEFQCISEIDKGNFDFALVSPLIFSAISQKNDERIIKANLLAAEDYSGDLTINIVPQKAKLSTIFFEELNEFVIVATKLLLSERYGIEPILVKNPAEADIVLTLDNQKYENSEQKYENYIKLDLTEDWYDTFEIPLIFGFWITANEKFDVETVNKINSFAAKNLTVTTKTSSCNCDSVHCEHNDDKNEHNHKKLDNFSENDDNFERIGYKHWAFDDRFINSLEKTFDLLFYRNFASHITDVKFAGSENA